MDEADILSLSLLGGLLANYLWKLWWVDYVSAGVILVFILVEALQALEEIRGYASLFCGGVPFERYISLRLNYETTWSL